MSKKPVEKAAGKTAGRSGVDWPACRVVVLFGKEAFLRGQHAAECRAALEAVHGPIEPVRFSGLTHTWGEILDEARSFGLMAAHKIVLVDDADAINTAAERDKLSRYVAGPTESCTLILRDSTWQASGVDKAIASVGTIIKCEPPAYPDAVRFVREAAARHGAGLEAGVPEALLDRLGIDLGRLDTEVAKLALAGGAGAAGAGAAGGGLPTIRLADLADTAAVRTDDWWKVQGPMLSGDAAAALGQLRVILDRSTSDLSTPTMYGCVDLCRKLHVMSASCRAGDTPGRVSKVLKLWGDSAVSVTEAARALPARATLRLFRTAAGYDQGLKSGLGDGRRRLEMLAVQLAGEIARAGGPRGGAGGGAGGGGGGGGAR